MEVVWVRQFTPYLGTVVYAFAAILALYLLATFLGSRLYRCWARSGRRHGDDWRVLGCLLGVTALLPLLAADPRLPVPGFVRRPPPRARDRALLRDRGVPDPTAGRPLLGRRPRGGRGHAYAINVLGCILGPLLAGFVLLPARGGALVAGGPEPAAARIGIAWPPWASRARPRRAGCGDRSVVRAGRARRADSLAVVLVAFDVATTRPLFPQRKVRRDCDRHRDRDRHQGLRKPSPGQRLRDDGPHADHQDDGAPPARLPPQAAARNVLVICFGMGTSFRSSLPWGIPTTAVELVPSVPGLFALLPRRRGPSCTRSPRARIVIDDARRFLERTAASSTTCITVDPPPPVEAAASSLLYSREFYALVRRARDSRRRPAAVARRAPTRPS